MNEIVFFPTSHHPFIDGNLQLRYCTFFLVIRTDDDYHYAYNVSYIIKWGYMNSKHSINT